MGIRHLRGSIYGSYDSRRYEVRSLRQGRVMETYEYYWLVYVLVLAILLVGYAGSSREE
jgi:hypothetical protein|tara:strand:+ start:227 stop:403 length:177 start_codon:yes stop_codon:yes gene_type:complete